MRIRFVFFIAAALLLAACSSRRVVTETTDAGQTSTAQHDTAIHVGIESAGGTAKHEAKHVYDSIYTHVIIYRYDTITQRVVEKIVIEQAHVNKDESQTEQRDTMHVSAAEGLAVHHSDSVASVIHTQVVAERKADMKKRMRWIFFAILLATLFFVIYRIKKNMF